jgi:glycosyltransferase involved in cell wall biosynthesis
MKNILVITYWSFKDALIQTYTLPYVTIIGKHIPQGSKVYLITLEKDHKLLDDVTRQEIQSRLPPHITWLPFKYYRFGIRAALSWMINLVKLAGFISRNNIQVLHAWATPAGAIGYLLAVITGRKLVIDSYEPHAEAMVENGTWTRRSIAFRILFWLERKQTRKASAVISATEGMREYARVKYNSALPDFFVKPACVDLDLFSRKNLKRPDLVQSMNLSGKIVCVYAGKFGGIYLDHEVFDLMKHAHDHWGDRLRILLLTSHSPGEIDALCKVAGLDRAIVITRFVPHAEIADYIGLGDFALTPVKPVPTKKYCTPIKDGEYWALGLPVVISRDISDDSAIIGANSAGVVIDRYEAGSFSEAFRTLDRILAEPTEARFNRIRALAEKYRNFSIADRIYESVYGGDFK